MLPNSHFIHLHSHTVKHRTKGNVDLRSGQRCVDTLSELLQISTRPTQGFLQSSIPLLICVYNAIFVVCSVTIAALSTSQQFCAVTSLLHIPHFQHIPGEVLHWCWNPGSEEDSLSWSPLHSLRSSSPSPTSTRRNTRPSLSCVPIRSFASRTCNKLRLRTGRCYRA